MWPVSRLSVFCLVSVHCTTISYKWLYNRTRNQQVDFIHRGKPQKLTEKTKCHSCSSSNPNYIFILRNWNMRPFVLFQVFAKSYLFPLMILWPSQNFSLFYMRNENLFSRNIAISNLWFWMHMGNENLFSNLWFWMLFVTNTT